MGSVLTTVVIDCHDPTLVARFWAAALGWRVGEPVDEDEAIPVGDGTGEAPLLLFQPVPEGKTVKNRIHFDVSPLGAEQPDELVRLLRLGARPVALSEGDRTWHVLADPEGNEFCLLRERHD